ncbi:MAG TPA: hypothetical protein VFK86_17590, partial [Bauldia sp.]|nr:hypothetical protein [Bauldia sp.]
MTARLGQGDMRLPDWARLVILASAVMQVGFGATLLIDPGAIGELWPWTLPPLSTRLLGASALVSVPLGLLAVWVNRFVAAMIPLAMMITYRVLQLVAGLIHVDRFEAFSLTTLNYFGGGALMLAVYGYCLWAGAAGRLPEARPGARWGKAAPWLAPPAMPAVLTVLALVYALLGLWFLFAGGNAAGFWIDAGGLTPLTARLFSSPLIGLGLGLYLCSRASDWRAVMTPAVGLLTIGVAGTVALVLERSALVTPTPVAWLIAATPPVLLLLGVWLIAARPPSEEKARVRLPG